jgi:hypothetical protein
MYMMSFMPLGIFLDRSADATQSPRPLRPSSFVDPYRVPVHGFDHTFLHHSSGRISQVLHRTSRLLVNILLSGSTLHFSWLCALGTGLVKHDLPPEVSLAVKRRIVVAQSLYAFGALLCVFSTYWSIAFIVLVQLSVVIAPFGRRSRS